MLTARQLKIIKLIMNNPGIHGKEISENLNVFRKFKCINTNYT